MLESWHLACLGIDPERQDQAADYSKALLEIEPTHHQAILWTIGRNFDVDLALSEVALRKRFEEATASGEEILSLLNILLATEKPREAIELLENARALFQENMAESVWMYWYIHCLIVDNQVEAALTEIEKAELTMELRQLKGMVLRNLRISH